MQITVLGAGAIGGVVGAYLWKNGHDVLLVDAARDHVAAINRDGLLVDGSRGESRVRPPAVTPDRMPDLLDIVMLCVKAQHTEAAIAPVVPRLVPNGVVVSLQNGLNEILLSRLLGEERTVGAFLNWGGDYQGPGHVRFGLEGSFYLGELDGRVTDRVKSLAGLLNPVAPVQVTSNIWGYLWSKEALGAILFATALVDADVADILATQRFQRLMVALAGEAAEVAAALGVNLEPFDGFEPGLMRPRTSSELRNAADSLVHMGETYWRTVKVRSGVWRDLAVRHRPTEVDHLVGAVVDMGEKAACPARLNRELVRMIHDVEQGRSTMSWLNLDQLDASARDLYPALYSL